VVVVAGDEHDLRPGRQRGAELLEHRPGGGQGLAGGAVAQLDGVAQQHEAVDLGQARGERSARGRAVAQDVDAGATAEVQVGDDERAHRPRA
jgi:hypothetical protein